MSDRKSITDILQARYYADPERQGDLTKAREEAEREREAYEQGVKDGRKQYADHQMQLLHRRRLLKDREDRLKALEVSPLVSRVVLALYAEAPHLFKNERGEVELEWDKADFILRFLSDTQVEVIDLKDNAEEPSDPA